MKKGSSFVFLDPSGRRWPRLRFVLILGSILLLAGLFLFAHSLWKTPKLKLPPHLTELKHQLHSITTPTNPKRYQPQNRWLEFYKKSPQALQRMSALHQRLEKDYSTAPVRLGFYVSWDPNSFTSLQKNAQHLTHVAAEWFTMSDTSSIIVEEADPGLQDFLRNSGIRFLPTLTNLSGSEWQPEPVEALLMGPSERRQAFVLEIRHRLESIHSNGILIDWQQIDPTYRSQLTELLALLARGLHEDQRELWLSVPVGHDLRPFDLDALSPFVDRFVGILHDENSDQDDPGPVASMDWFDGWIQTFMAYGEPRQWIITLGSYGYDWALQNRRAETLSFVDVMTLAHHAEVPFIESRKPTYNPSFEYRKNDIPHQVWFLDAITFLNQARTANAYHVGGLGLFRLGTEDPLVWEAIKQTDAAKPNLASLETLSSGDWISHLGEGEFVSIDETRKPGKRNITPAAYGRYESRYTEYPQYPAVFHQGGDHPNWVALTFDDGPDPKWTPSILKILKEKKAPAAFFILGNKAESYPELVHQIDQEGHEIGNHSYTHANLSASTREHVILELNATQRLIEFILGRSTLLFRPPYQADARPKDLEDLRPIAIGQSLGYITVCENIDPEDWQQPPAEILLQRIKEKRRFGNIILLHDAGGNRSQTVEALPHIIDWLRARGDTIVPLHRLIGIPKDQLMPLREDPEEKAPHWITLIGFRLLHWLEEFAWTFMIFASFLMLLRTIAVAWLASRHPAQKDLDPSFHEPLSILLPAHNEEKVIEKTIHTLLKSEGIPEFEILVIDDGSTDQTAARVENSFRDHPQVRLIHQENQGKSVALQRGLQEARHSILITLDADTQFQPDTLRFLIEPLQNPEVVAVSGHVKVGNTRPFIARCQALEYTCGFNLDRRAYDQLNAITVVPGAACALRKEAVLQAGGFTHDTLAEDTDLTLQLHRLGGRITYAPRAIAWTEAPETVAGLLKQRFRWCFGTMQCLWKHRDLVFNLEVGAVGWFSLPGIWFFQMLLVALIPAVDLMLILSLILGSGNAILPFFLLFLGVDLLLAVLASHLEDEPLLNSLLMIPMRFLYRPLLAWVVWKSLIRAYRGVWVTWTRVERKGSVDVR